MGKSIFSVFIFLLAAFIVTPLFALPNPAAVYCERLGYQYKIVKTAEAETGVCIVGRGIEFNAWDFYRGKDGKEYSYCAQYGYDIESERKDEGGFFTECAVCVKRSKGGEERIPMLELMKKNGEPLMDLGESGAKLKGGSNCEECRKSREECNTCPDIEAKESTPSIIKGTNRQLPSSFDWRDKDSHAYIGAIRDQGACGSCYAFAAVASAEGTYNYASGLYDGNRAEFSESFIMWCLGRLAEYNPHFYGCDGADWEYAELEALTTDGICSLANFPYTTVDPGACTHWGDPLTIFSDWGRVACSDVDAIKTAIMTYGPVDAAVLVGTDFQNYDSGIYSDANTDCPGDPGGIGEECYYTYTNHAIGLVGWDDNPPEGGGGVWILRNSWDTTWGESGYMRIRYTSARVACEATYLQYNAVATHTIHALSGEHGNILPSGDVVVSDGAGQPFAITPDEGYHIDDVVVDSTSQGAINTYVFQNVTANHTIEARFAPNNHTITATTGEGGTISPSGNVTVSHGADQTFTITPNILYSVADVVVDGTSQGAISSYTFENVTADHTIGASFTLLGRGSDGGGGNDDEGGGMWWWESNCFIATAAYGTPMTEEVKILSRFRDECLLTNPLGKIFVMTYYKISPPIADFIREHPVLKNVVRKTLKPLIWISRETTE